MNEYYKALDHSDKKYKPLILEWLANLFGYTPYPHSFKDQWINWDIHDGELHISFDLREKDQATLLSLIPKRFLGVPQSGTLKIVNETSFYLTLKRLIHIEYPDIVGSKLITKQINRGGTGGWYSKSDEFYTYDWQVNLNDSTSIFYHNQKENMDMTKGDLSYNAIIQERAFIKFLNKINVSYEK